MKITIIGWYGTETIGDRAILAGVFSVCNKTVTEHNEYKLGAIYPFFTERTLLEDKKFLKRYANIEESDLTIFSSKNKSELENAIKWCDVVLIGGGPLEDIPSMYMLEYAFKYAKKKMKKSLVFGCGLGPLYKRKYIKSALNIIKNSTMTIFRDKGSIEEYVKMGGDRKDCSYSCDLSVFPLEYFKKEQGVDFPRKEQIVISVRAFPEAYKISEKINSNNINNKIIDFCAMVANQNECSILFVPMHYFAVGDDDRYFMNEIVLKLDRDNLYVQNQPLSLEETMHVFRNSKYCIGMRYHSVVFQTLLNGCNLILDYTDPQGGKIGNFLNVFGIFDAYKKSYCNLQKQDVFPVFDNLSLKINEQIIENFEAIYIENLKEALR